MTIFEPNEPFSIVLLKMKITKCANLSKNWFQIIIIIIRAALKERERESERARFQL